MKMSVPRTCEANVNGPQQIPYKAVDSPRAVFRRRKAASSKASRPSEGAGMYVGISSESANGWLATLGGASSDHTRLHPRISASICKSNMTGCPSGR